MPRPFTQLFTIGHSNQSQSEFLDTLRAHGIKRLIDVRSKPYSKFVPHFNRESLQRAVRGVAMEYLFLGDQLGAHEREPECYVDGRISYVRAARTKSFAQGLHRLLTAAAQTRSALMCAEQDPLHCHRGLLICRHLSCEDVDVQHILRDGRIESQAKFQQRLLDVAGLGDDDFINQLVPRSQRLASAYAQVASDPENRENDGKTT
ncbi:MAG: DUF488 domain-containing protein [Gammaproteobacteria bacterium]|nr:DUF488 domain-containing protein [Gammaproteobacteria bacterium]